MRYSALESTRAEAPERPVQCWLLLGTTYATIVSSALLLAVAEHTMGYALMAAVFCAGHALVVGPRGPACLSASVGKLLAIGALAYGLLQAGYTSVDISYGLAHFLILVQLVKLYGPHTVRDLRLIQVAAVFVTLVASLWAMDLLYLPAFLLAALSLMAGLTALSMFPPATEPAEAEARAMRAWATWRHLASALWLPAVAVFGGTAVLFVLLPRIHLSGSRYGKLTEQVVGFSENVSLHEVGRLRQSEDLVMRVQFWAADQVPQKPLRPSRVLMRGLSLPFYRDGQWFGHSALHWPEPPAIHGDEARPLAHFASLSTYLLKNRRVTVRHVRQRVSVEMRPLERVFSLYRLIWFEGSAGGRDRISPLDDTIVLSRAVKPGESYDAVSLVPRFTPGDLRQAGTPRSDQQSWYFWYVPDELQGTLRRVADEILSLYPAQTDYDRIISAQRYLLQSGLFTYTYDLPPLGLGDPIETFLTQTRLGSCEQFSTALALILRLWGMPARLAIGFKDGEYDRDTETYTFRDKHAHAWVEVFFTGLGWVEFDPTPGLMPAAGGPPSAAGRLGSLLERIQALAVRAYRSVRGHWTGNVIGYSRTKQRRILAGFSKAASNLAARAAGIVGPLWPGMPALGMLQVAVLVVMLTLVGMGLYLLARWFQGKARRANVLPHAGRTLWFYRDMLRILQRKGVVRPAHLTPREFVSLAAVQLGRSDCDGPPPREAIQEVTDLYYRVRFGGREPTPQQLEAVRAALGVLRKARRAAGGGGPAPAVPGADLS